MGVANAFYSFGVSHPGAITLHNYPRFLQRLERPDGTVLDLARDLAATDLMRIRERGVPRYNDFRELFHRGRVKSFEELTGDEEKAAELERIYGDVDRLDLMIGLYSEPLPKARASASATRPSACSSSWPRGGSRATASSRATTAPRCTRPRASSG